MEVVRDPCHPVHYNPIRPAFPTGGPSVQHMLVAGHALAKGDLLGAYWGDLLTHK